MAWAKGAGVGRELGERGALSKGARALWSEARHAHVALRAQARTLAHRWQGPSARYAMRW